jgi:hypothetical protein
VSPLGKYAAPAAALGALGIIGAYLAALLFGTGLAVPVDSVEGLKDLALLAAGALFGSAVAVNGYKAPVAAAHARLDAMGAPPAAKVHEAAGAIVSVKPDGGAPHG